MSNLAMPGYTGTLTVDGVTTCASAVTFDEEMALNESPSFCSEGWMTFQRGFKSATGTVDTYDRITGDTGALVISNSNAAAVTYTATVFFNSKNMEQTATDNVTFSHSFTCDGEWTIS